MNSTKKNIRKTSGTRKNVIKVAYSGKYKPGQLVTINHRVFRIVKNIGARIIVCVVMTEISKNMISAWNYQ